MGWTTPRNWTAGELVTAAEMNTHVRDNLNYLYNVNHSSINSLQPTGGFTTTSTTFVDWATGFGGPLSVTFTKRGGTETNLEVEYWTQFHLTGAAGNVHYGANVSGTDYDSGFNHNVSATLTKQFAGGIVVATGLAAGSFTVKLRVRVTGVWTFNTDANDFGLLRVHEVYGT